MYRLVKFGARGNFIRICCMAYERYEKLKKKYILVRKPER
jgi:hypothetical protein